jgi:hypothetical protein
MSAVTGTLRPGTTDRPVAWWARETRIGRHLYPLRAVAVAAATGAATAVVGVPVAVALLAR